MAVKLVGALPVYCNIASLGSGLIGLPPYGGDDTRENRTPASQHFGLPLREKIMLESLPLDHGAGLCMANAGHWKHEMF